MLHVKTQRSPLPVSHLASVQEGLGLTRPQAEGVALANETYQAAIQPLQRQRLHCLAVLEEVSLMPQGALPACP